MNWMIGKDLVSFQIVKEYCKKDQHTDEMKVNLIIQSTQDYTAYVISLS